MTSPEVLKETRVLRAPRWPIAPRYPTLVKIAVLLSGGVDSSVALSLLREQGHDLTAFYLKVWLEDELSHLGTCPWEEDLGFAREVASRLGVPLEVRSLQRQYWDRVVRYAVSELRAGLTPSPDVLCNQRIKFGAFLDEIDPSFEAVASGHYARLERRGEGLVLKRGVDPVKDQTYFLALLSGDQLARAVFPLGGLSKTEVRAIAAARGLPNKDRRDSQGICFLGKIKYHEFVRHHLGEQEGDIVESGTGTILGKHRGYWFHTIGQRQGLRLSHGPWFVQAKDVERNLVYVTHADRSLEASRDSFDVEAIHWIGEPFAGGELRVRVRHGRALHRAWLEHETDRGRVRLEATDRGIAPGQFAVFYRDEVCLGGGTIV
jgi:tRNA (5-methylaminomethyl-2-thiouridylate)-methyltransferase